MTRSSRDSILSRLRSALPQSTELPALPADDRWQTFRDPVEQFSTVLESVGGHCEKTRTLSEANDRLRQLEQWQNARVRVSTVAGVGDSTCDEAQAEDPHELENVDFAVLPGRIAVAENGAVWVTDDNLRHRVLYFIPQYIALVVPGQSVVHNMHGAYERIDVGPNRFAAFISGPSKTADIEQSLVIGAHGARSLTVFLVDELAT
jgi:L-lactate dehydrogenase complex protein LldG